MTLVVEKLNGGYGQYNVLRQVSFQIESGELLVLVGLNGSGKSTTIHHLTGLRQPTGGNVTLNGISLLDDPIGYKKQIAYVPEQPVIYPELTVQQHIQLVIDVYELENTIAWEEADKLLAKFHLANKKEWYPVHFSKGMRQKLMIVMAFILNADLYIVDEPFIGLDVKAIGTLLTLMQEKKAAGAKLLVTTHMVERISAIADRYVALDNGEVIKSGMMQDYVSPFED